MVVYRKMISNDQVNMFASGCVSAGNFAAASFVVRAQIPMVLCSILPPRPEEQKWAYSMLPPPRFEMESRYRYLKEKTDVRKVGIMHDPTPYAMLMRDVGVKVAQEFGIEVVGVESYKPDDSDMSVQIGRMNAAGAGAILKMGQGGSTVTLAKNIKQLGLDKMLLLGSLDDGAPLKAAGEVLGERFLFVAPGVQIPDSIPAGPARETADAFLKVWRAKYGDRDANGGARGWDSVAVITTGVQKAGSADGGAVRDAIEKISGPARRVRQVQLRPRPARRHHREPICHRRAARWRVRAEMSMAEAPAAFFEARALSAFYGRVHALKPTSVAVEAGEFVTVLGPNGAGKSTMLRAMTRLTPATGQVLFEGRDITRLKTHERARAGIIMVQEGRGLFGQMSVRENLVLGAYTRAGGETIEQRLEGVFALFPRLRERYEQVSSSLSGGEQQMLAIGRALMAKPKLLMLDEPSLGLAPRVAAEILETLGRLNAQGLGILLVEQKAPLALRLASRVYVLSLGAVVAELPASEITSHHDLSRYYLQ